MKTSSMLFVLLISGVFMSHEFTAIADVSKRVNGEAAKNIMNTLNLV